MQSNLNNDNNHKSNNKQLSKKDKDELLLQNSEILNTLILENYQKKDKSFITYKEMDIIKDFEQNLITLIGNCPPKILKTLMEETDSEEQTNLPNGKSNSENNK
jgi:hypothetical protein